MICKQCDGSGHDKQSVPLIRIDKVKTAEGVKAKYTTVKQGSGCMGCLGRGVKPEPQDDVH